MSKIICIKEDEHSRTFSNVKKLVTNTSDGGTATWIPEDEAVDYVEKESLSVTENGTYKAKDGAIFSDVTVNVEQHGDDETEGVHLIPDKTINANGVYKASDEAGGDDKHAGYESVTVDLPLESKTITKNGVYNAADDVDSLGRQIQGYSSLDIEVGEGGSSKLVSKDIKKNGEYLPSDEGEDIDGFSQVNVALPFIDKKIIDHGGIYRASAEQDANGDEIQGYKSIEVNIKVVQPTMDCTMNVDHHENIRTLPLDISIGNTAREDYTDYEIQNPPVVDFSNATMKVFSENNTYPLDSPSLNLGPGLYMNWPKDIDGTHISNCREASDFVAEAERKRLNVWMVGGWITGFNTVMYGRGDKATFKCFPNDKMRTVEQDNVLKYIFSGKFELYGGDGFAIAYSNLLCGWLVSNISYNKGDNYSFTISIKTQSA